MSNFNAEYKRALRLYEKAGFVHEGRMRQAVFKHGSYRDLLYKSVHRDEWKARRKEGQ